MVQSLDDARRRHGARNTGGGGGPAGRVPPHNLQAEESLLGAMLLSRDAIAAAVEVCSADDFYKPAHGHVFDAICSLYGHGEPADPVTVADELRRADLLDAIGGPATLISLQANTPATTNASRYARIVEEHALLRRLIGVAGEIAEMSYGVPEDVADAVDRAESLVFEVAERRVTDSLRPLHDLLSESLDRLEALYDRGEAITGVPTGFVDLDERLSGLQRSSLVIIGARPSMGKALALDTPVPTPDGWTTMGDLRVGDRVFDEAGAVCRVTYATPVMYDHTVYRVTFDEGSSLVADADHQWAAYDRTMTSRVVTTRQMLSEGPHWYIPVSDALDLPAQPLPVEPYLLGTNRKYLPPLYLRSSRSQRLVVLQGLMDMAGTVNAANGNVQLSLGNHALVSQARDLVSSLGFKPGPIRRRVVRRAARLSVSWRFAWTPTDDVFRSPDKCRRLEETKARRVGRRHTRRAVVAIDPVPSVPVRCITVDSPNHQYLVGDTMIPTHNTALALNLSAHAAMESATPVLFFSLEMSHSEVTQRLLCSEARVESTRVRNGKLLESDWPKISNAIGRLGEAPLYIDDNPNLTVMEIRAKARRLRSRLGDLGLIVVDYLQLMSGRHNAENRQVEVSEISRGLKILARELEVPVIALSQLSRNLETRADKRPVLADLRESGCMPASTRLLRADTGEEVTLGSLVLTQEQPLVWSVDEHQRLVPARLVKAFPSGIKPVYTMRLASGRSVQATGNHRFLGVNGWEPLDKLSAGSFIAVPRRLPAPTDAVPEWSDDALTLLAHLIGDGSMGPSVKYATADPANKLAVEEAAWRLFHIHTEHEKRGNTWQLRFPSPYQLTRGVHHPMRDWLEPLGLWQSRAWTKHIPPSIFGQSEAKLAHFLHHLWATDGSITIGRNRRGPVVTTYYSTSSFRLALDVQQLLLRFGIRSTIGSAKKRRVDSTKDGIQYYREGYSVRIPGAANQAHFLRTVGCHARRGACIPEALAILGSIKESRTRQRRYSRSRLLRMARLLKSRQLEDFATSDLYWDKIIEITFVGDQPTFDATVEGTHNFVADGIISHNSLEQDADVVMFLYRDEVYNPESQDRGTAELIISKHRNGPTGITRLAFLDHYTRFANMARV
ncbi:MAG TPA: replicative DNA helicase [Acidimicrobiales bacterium]|jgi:replicative DNA helicase|nr:replicative DNA helicase [Acidimicrobiales bacterium]